ncbi:MAG: hydroxyacid dehydrogenase [Microbacteriaceae bacterium]|nr:hydroxyacid dehydrogenase [Microbacteriaceae bacterium]
MGTPGWNVMSTSPSFGRFSQLPVEVLVKAGCSVELVDGRDEDAVTRALRTADAWIVGNEPVSAATIADAPRLKVIAKSGAGTDNIDLSHLGSHGIRLVNLPSRNAPAVAEYALAQIMTLSRRIVAADAAVRAGEWPAVLGRTLNGRSLGILGFGAIGKELARLAHGLGMTVLAHSRSADAEGGIRHSVQVVGIGELFAGSDFLAVCLPYSAETRGLVGRRELALLKPGAFLVNVGRGGIVDEAAVAEALHSGALAGAAFDVFEQEPIDRGNPLLTTPNTLLSPHSASYGDLVLVEVGVACAEALLAALDQQQH